MTFNNPPALETRLTIDVVDGLLEEYELEVCQRDYNLLESYHPGIFALMCKLVANGIELEDIRKRTARIVRSEPVILQRVYNAARYERKLQVR